MATIGGKGNDNESLAGMAENEGSTNERLDVVLRGIGVPRRACKHCDRPVYFPRLVLSHLLGVRVRIATDPSWCGLVL